MAIEQEALHRLRDDRDFAASRIQKGCDTENSSVS